MDIADYILVFLSFLLLIPFIPRFKRNRISSTIEKDLTNLYSSQRKKKVSKGKQTGNCVSCGGPKYLLLHRCEYCGNEYNQQYQPSSYMPEDGYKFHISSQIGIKMHDPFNPWKIDINT